MIRDRGNIKWAGMMLTEHIRELRYWMDEDHYEERPELDDFALQSIQEEIEVAYKSKNQILIKTWKDGKFMTRGGAIKTIDLQSKSIVLDNPFGLKRIPVAEIISAQYCE
ncbi:MAG TPA: YolD-like family protein [Sporosarcina psychrophila]|uniref:YolD-like family protein n=1 Tax=Sporosarcina psychrophila TaxID=1476 RepID=A0A921FZG1_SPOPS|nr:YolD-like family protein [Sporosarcina psychrophila]